MLIALELAGFKSFADRTRFEFPDGITVIVGPNGSGKSNVVDAIKWVLGAQSAKALRGKDMIDVIFKGSNSSGRKPCNSAEATLVFDNSQKLLSVDSEEVQVTRRVYRSGEGEYLINGDPCRLKDIKNLFRGTGVGVDAYSLIEQGKVDRMLQASPKDRRVIFEEAAGISRFNAKKAEAHRRLQRVDQNLVRLKDIVDEVHGRLSRLKSQASRAQKYREMTSRLEEIRLQLGWTEYSELSAKHQSAQETINRIELELESYQQDLEVAKASSQQAEMELHGVAQQCQDVELRLQETQQRIAVGQNQQAALRQRIEESNDEQRRQSTKLAALRSRAGALQGEVDDLGQQVKDSQAAYDQSLQLSNEVAQRVARLRDDLSQRATKHEALRSEHLRLLHDVSEKSAEVAQQNNQLSELTQSIATTNDKLAENEQKEQSARQAATNASNRLKAIHQQKSQLAEELSAAQQDLKTNTSELTTVQEHAAVLQGRLQGASERLSILEQLQQHLEGVDSGARHVLDLAKKSDEAMLKSVRGLVAEMLEVDVNLAPLIDTALGHTSNALVLSSGELIQGIRAKQFDIPGRLSLIRLDRLPTRRFGEKVQLDGVRGVIGRADRLISCADDVTPLFKYLLGTTWLVEDLEIALELGHFRGAGLRFVTAECQLIEADGTLTIGAMQTSSGLVSRRSEIHDAKQEISDCKAQYQKSQGDIERITVRTSKLTPRVQELEEASRKAAQEFAHQQAVAQNAVGKLDEIEARRERLQQVLADYIARREAIEPAIAPLVQEVEAQRAEIQEIEQQLSTHDQSVRRETQQLSTASEEETAARIELARTEQRLESVRAAYDQSMRNQSERQLAVNDAVDELQRIVDRRNRAEHNILDLTSSLALDYLGAEQVEAELEELAIQAAALRRNRAATTKQLETVQRQIDKLTSQLQAANSDRERFQESSDGLLKRYQEDYQIDFETLSRAELIEDESLRSDMDAEASGLRQDIASVGEINMAALNELDELQQRYDFLNSQYEDLVAGKESLQRIIHKINADSRKMFTETLEIIRQNFQKLYRKSFGGGTADIVLEAGEDVLECGIDIIATPPGKTALSNSLLSGGEKALTAVALLLAIFQYRPSPFCVLDEVDAPFDEANIGRFVGVLSEFLDWTKFIIVTHSKKTMTASTTLYGVTMQESGVSKQVAVRFEDVNEKGEIINPDKKRSAA